MLVSAVAVPIVGKLSDLYGRRWFYLGGLAIFLVGSILSGASQDFWFLVFARAVQGLGMGTLMPLSQTIIGDIIPPRQRGKYQGIMGAIFGVTSIAGPLIGGSITDSIGWRWLFYLTLPIGVAAFVFIYKFLHLNTHSGKGKVDFLGMVTLTPGLVIALLATTWGGTSYAWTSPVIISMYAVAAVFLVAFVIIETKVEEPMLPLSVLGKSEVALSVIASFAIAVAMFGAIIYIPVYAQGVLGVSATNSGAILIPQSVAMIATSIIVGLLITKFGRYKPYIVVGGLIIAVGVFLLTRVSYGDSQWHLTLAMIVFGLGLGLSQQVYTLIVQNSVKQSELGVATSAVQFFRNLGSTVGTAVLGTVMSRQMASAIPERIKELTPEQLAQLQKAGGGSIDASGLEASVLDPSALEQLPDFLAEAVRKGMDDAMHDVFLTALPFAILAFVVAIFVKESPLRNTLSDPEKRPGTTTGSIPVVTGQVPVVADAVPDEAPEGVPATPGADGTGGATGDGGAVAREIGADAADDPRHRTHRADPEQR
jgi:EmrB/QacA subfamily drug resistance transporter